jgi:hypothetical protein
MLLGDYNQEGRYGEYCKRYYMERGLQESARALFMLELLQSNEENQKFRNLTAEKLKNMGKPCKFGHDIGSNFVKDNNDDEEEPLRSIALHLFIGDNERELLEVEYKTSGTILSFPAWVGNELIQQCSKRYNHIVAERELRVITATHLTAINLHLEHHSKKINIADKLKDLEEHYKFFSVTI